MAAKEGDASQSKERELVLTGTTRRIYRYMFKAGTPLNLHEIQRGLGLSSPSVVQYHIRKLLQAGLVSEGQAGYVVDRSIFENMVRLGRMVIPIQTTYLAFFVASLVIMLTLFRPTELSSLYVFALTLNLVALVAALHGTLRARAGL